MLTVRVHPGTQQARALVKITCASQADMTSIGPLLGPWLQKSEDLPATPLRFVPLVESLISPVVDHEHYQHFWRQTESGSSQGWY